MASTLPTEKRELMTLTLVIADERLKFALAWKKPDLTADQQYEVAVAVDRIMRDNVPLYRQRIEQIDATNELGHRVRDLPPLAQKMLEKWLHPERQAS
jgi:hypothetical protein